MKDNFEIKDYFFGCHPLAALLSVGKNRKNKSTPYPVDDGFGFSASAQAYLLRLRKEDNVQEGKMSTLYFWNTVLKVPVKISAMLRSFTQSRNSGMTLMELVIAVALVGILSATAFSICQPLILQYKVNATSRKLAMDLLEARLKAISQHNNFVVQFYAPDTNGNYKYTIFSDDNGNGVKDQNEYGREFPLRKGIHFISEPETMSPFGEIIEETDGVTFPGNKFTFAPRGSSSGSGSVYLIPAEDVTRFVHYDHCRALTITNTTGRIRVWKYCPQGSPVPWE
ncbi:MAG: prepilin-type N-terminal cleavage/methylation domain-containing protein [bacterium]